MIELSKQQAQAIAKIILPDIEAYVQSHQEEYAEFLRVESSRTDCKTTSADKIGGAE